MEISRIATGYKCGLAVEVHGTRGTLLFDQERMNELRFYSQRRIAPAGAASARSWPDPSTPTTQRSARRPGHGLGINDLKVIEIRNLIRAIRSGTDASPDFAEGLRVQQVMSAIELAAQQRSWVDVEQVGAA